MNVLLKTNLNVNGLCYFLLGILFFDFKMAFLLIFFVWLKEKSLSLETNLRLYKIIYFLPDRNLLSLFGFTFWKHSNNFSQFYQN